MGRATFAVLAALALFSSALFAEPGHRIQVRQNSGRGELYDAQTGDTFVPRGNNYIRLAYMQAFGGWYMTYHSTFNVGLYDFALTEATLARMQSDGYNTVRVFVQGQNEGSVANANGGLNSTYLDNFTDFLTRAKAHGIYVVITMDAPPITTEYNHLYFQQCCTDFNGAHLSYLTSGGVAANKKFWSEFIQGLSLKNAPLDAILGYELVNELSFDSSQPPFTLSKSVTTANGKTYDMSSADSRQAMQDDNLVYFVDQMRTAIRALDPTALVTVGLFQAQQPHPCRYGDSRIIRAYPAIANSTADFVDLHPYPNVELSMSEYADNFGMNGYNRQPIIMGEFGAFTSRFYSAADAALGLQRWQYQSCAFNYAGWMVWTWDTLEQPELWNARHDDGRIEGVLSSTFRTNPCSPHGFSAAKLDFGSVPKGTAAPPQSVTITNLADSTIPLGAISITGGQQIDDQCPANLSAGASCTVTVNFRALKTGTNAEVLSVADPTTGIIFGVKVTGAAPVISVTRPARPPRPVETSSQGIQKKNAQPVTAGRSTNRAVTLPNGRRTR